MTLVHYGLLTFCAGLLALIVAWHFVGWLQRRGKPPTTETVATGDVMFIGANIPEPTWEWSLDPKFWISMRPPGKPPSLPHRVAQRVFLGVRWRPIPGTNAARNK
jgi:hypothetical protein